MKARKQAAGSGPTQVAKATFKARRLELIAQMRETGAEYVVAKHARPVIRLGPYNDTGRTPLFGALKGTGLGFEWPLDPIDDRYDIPAG